MCSDKYCVNIYMLLNFWLYRNYNEIIEEWSVLILGRFIRIISEILRLFFFD